MFKFFFKPLYLFLLNGFLFYVIEYHIWPRVIQISPVIWGHIVVGAIFALINWFIKPILRWISLPFRWLTLGMFGMAINGILLYVLSQVLSQFDISGVTLVINGGALYYVLLGMLLGLGNALLTSRNDKK